MVFCVEVLLFSWPKRKIFSIVVINTLNLLRNSFHFQEKSDEKIKLISSEIKVSEQLSKGLKCINLANNLFVSPSTVRRYIENIYSKLQVHRSQPKG
jgi:DNA-binding NarL/FixJ family response regulator